MSEVKIVFEKSAGADGKVGRGRPSKFAVMEDGTKIAYKEWVKTQPKGKRGRKPMPRDEKGNIIKAEKIVAVEAPVAEAPVVS